MMFERETESIIESVRQRTIGESSGIIMKDLLASDIPHPLKRFFRADVETMLLDELHRERKGSRFNFHHPEVESLQTQMNSVLVLNYMYTRLEFLQRLNDGVHMLINYLVRPQWTLASILFERKETATAAAIARLLRHLGPYEYLRELIARYIREKNVAQFMRPDFESLVWKIDGEYIRRKSGDELARVTSPLYEFFDYPRRTSANTLPARALVRYFEDKGLSSIIFRIEGEIAQGRNGLSMHDLGQMLEDIRRSSGAFEVEKKDLDHKEPAPIPVAETPPPVEQHTKAIAIDASDRRRFVRKMFDGDDQSFDSALAAISKMATWKQASKYIDELFIANDIDPYSSEAERFTDVILHHYHPRT